MGRTGVNPTKGLALPHGFLHFPVFLPDATFGVVRGLDAQDLRRCGVSALQSNVFHLMQKPGSMVVKALGGLHRMMGWTGPIVVDSGGFQALSLLRDQKQGSITDRGLVLHPGGTRAKLLLSPEKCIQLQVAYGADVAICLDDCTHPDDPEERQAQSVRRTIHWARRCRDQLQRLTSRSGQRPLLLAVIQGGRSMELRRQCAEELLAMGFDAYGFGGWPLGEEGLLEDLLAAVRELVPARSPLHALGIGHPLHVVRCARMGYDLFDSVLPTRDARQGRLYTWARGEASLEGDWFAYVYLQDGSLARAKGPVSEGCSCATCTTYSLGYLHHLFQLRDALSIRLATIHNLSFMCQVMGILRAERETHDAGYGR